MKKGLISVIIPIYNVEPYLEKCLNSICTNTYQNLQIICVNDGSKDKCGAIIDRFAEEDQRIVPVHQENQGVAAARNQGLELAEGEYIAFVDSDDYIHPRYFEILLHCISSKNADVAICRAKRFKEGEFPKFEKYEEITCQRLDANSFFRHYYARHMVWGRLYHRRDLEKCRFTKEVRMAEDTLFNLLAVCSLDNPVVYATEAELYYYFIRDDSIMHASASGRIMDIGNWYAINRNTIQFKNNGWDWILPMEVLKTTLVYRYYTCYIQPNRLEMRRAHGLLKKFYGALASTKQVSLKERTKILFMIRFPAAYRMFRIMNDPTMLEWEKNAKKRRSKNNDKE